MRVPPHLSLPLRYALAVIAVVPALLLTLTLPPFAERGIFVLFLVAVVVSALYGGWGPGLLAICLSAFSLDYFFIPPPHTFTAFAQQSHWIGRLHGICSPSHGLQRGP